ncbi:LysR family transcriptional regulator [Marinobacterium lutimaris]|uniref:DNA-binding transcriptional regulator, LysR family n=1 Tax=Marinobacterium lutimaris TaxID=568106 RepID=A0A1H5TND2_9GAMM|nr:LysR family transcriptional regulator [Marinobacterium lutimaris]SEF63527.1 DNA-binding transcriptional regulator, LysR family [Marinobacterium lutimaris]
MSKRQLTLRQIEIIRAIKVAGSIIGAARLLNVSQPGLSRTMKHVESSLGIKLFTRSGGKYTPSAEASTIFAQLNDLYKKLNDLNTSLNQLEDGRGFELTFGSVPSIAMSMVPRSLRRISERHPDLHINAETLKLEEAIDYLLLGRGEFVCMSYRLNHPAIDFQPLEEGKLCCVVHRDHELAKLDKVSAEQIARFPLIGIDPADPYGQILDSVFAQDDVQYDLRFRVRFGFMVLGLVKQGLGVAILDSFSLADVGDESSELRVIPLEKPVRFKTYVAMRNDGELSSFAESFIDAMKTEMGQKSFT